MLIIGGTAHNLGAKIYSDENLAMMETDDAEKAVRVIQGRSVGRLIRPTNTNQDDDGLENEVAKLEKIYDAERNSVIFLAEGVGTNGTLAAVHYLITHWERLWSQYAESSFAICVECPTREKSRKGYLTPSVLVELPNGVQITSPRHKAEMRR